MKFLQQDIMVAQCSLHHNSTYFTNGYLDIAQKVLKDDTTFSVFLSPYPIPGDRTSTILSIQSAWLSKCS